MSGIATHPIAAPHGTRAHYVMAKCRCAPCRAANTQYYRDRQKQIDERRAEVKPSGPPVEGTLVRRGRPVRVKLCPGANGQSCVRSRPAWLRGQGDVCATCVERATVWNGNVPVEEARQHLLKLRRTGVGYKSVHDASDVANSTLARVLAGEGKIRAKTLKKILEVDDGARADHAVAPKRAVRRMKRQLEQLVGSGFRNYEIARLLGSNSPALQVGRTGGALVRNVAAVEKLWRRVERGELVPARPPFVDAAPVYAAIRELLEEGWIGLPELQERLGFAVALEHPRARMRRARAERVTSLAAELQQGRREADERAEREQDLERFALARNAAE